MAHELLLERQAVKFLRKLDPQVRKGIILAIEGLSSEPRPPGCVKLKAHANQWRIRKGSFRIRYQVDDDRKLVTILSVNDRKDAY